MSRDADSFAGGHRGIEGGGDRRDHPEVVRLIRWCDVVHLHGVSSKNIVVTAAARLLGIGKSTRASLEDCTASSAEHLCIGCGHPETDRSYCVSQHADMRLLVHGHPTSDPSTIQFDKWGVYMR